METTSASQSAKALIGRVLYYHVPNDQGNFLICDLYVLIVKTAIIAAIECIPCLTVKNVTLCKASSQLKEGKTYTFRLGDARTDPLPHLSDKEGETDLYNILFAHDAVLVSDVNSFPSIHGTQAINAVDITSKYTELLRPPNTLHRDILMHKPFNIRGQVWKLHIDVPCLDCPVWIEVLGRARGRGRGDVLHIMGTSAAAATLRNVAKELNRGDVILFRVVYPIYLWGRLQGFAMTARSSCNVLHTASGGTASVTGMSRSSRAHEGGNVQRLVQQTVVRTCAMGRTWLAYVLRRIAQCVSSLPSPPGTAPTAITSATSSRSSKTAPPGENTPLVDVCRSLVESLLTPNAAAVLSPPPERPTPSFLQEFCDDDIGPLWGVRGGDDVDWLCSLLPEVSGHVLTHYQTQK